MTSKIEKEINRLDKLEQKENNNKLDVVISEEKSKLENSKEKENKQVEVSDKKEIIENKLDESKVEKNKEKTTNKKSKNKIAIYIITVVAVLLLFAFIITGIVNKLNLNVYKGITIFSHDLSGMSDKQVGEFLKDKNEEILTKTLDIKQGKNLLISINSSDFDFKLDKGATIKNVMQYGRSQNIFKDTSDILAGALIGKKIKPVYVYDDKKIIEVVKEVKSIIEEKTIDDSYITDEKEYKLVINKGTAGNSIDENIFINDLLNGFMLENSKEIVLKIIKTDPEKLDVDVIYSNVVRAAEDAYIDKTALPPKLVPHQVGLDFNKEELKKVINNLEASKSEDFKLLITQPKTKLSDLTWDLYNYQISTYTTYFPITDQNRASNLKRSLEILDGKIVNASAIFSFNSTIGITTQAKGFKMATVFAGGTLAKEVGGGICQTVSTLYNAALLADLKIVQRKNHSLPVGYVPPSRDATVYYPAIDFKFENTRNYPLKIVTKFNPRGSMTISLLGSKEDFEPVVSISSKTISYMPYKVQNIYDNSLEKGKTIVVVPGTRGYTSEAYKTIKKEGKTTTVFLSRDVYKPLTRVVKLGTKEKEMIVVENPIDKPIDPPAEELIPEQ